MSRRPSTHLEDPGGARGRRRARGGGDPLHEAELALRFGEVDEAEAGYRAVVDRGGDPERRARAFAGLGQSAFARGDHAAAAAHLERALDLWPALEAADPALSDTLGRAYALTARYDAAVRLFRRRLHAAAAGGDRVQTIRFAILLANALADRGSFAQAERALAQGRALARERDDALAQARVAWTQSRLHSLEGDAEAAEEAARLALDILEPTEHVRYLGLAHQLLAHAKLDRGAAAEALELLERGLPLARGDGNAYVEAMFAVERARALVQLGEDEEARELLVAAAAELADSSQVDAGRAYALLGELEERLGEPDEAADTLRVALALLPLGDRYKLEAYARLARILRSQGCVDEALELLDAALALRAEAPAFG